MSDSRELRASPDSVGEDLQRAGHSPAGDAAATPRDVAQRYLEGVAAFWADPSAPQALASILALFAEDVDWDIPGDLSVVPWIGPRRSREAVGDFFRQLALHIEPQQFEANRIVADDETVVVLGHLVSKVKRTGRLITSSFAFDFIVRNGRIARYRMFEDSHAVAQATRD
ncbi:MAG: hypothetical protein GAK30_01245 [Paracidovorax wautersii]|uniref:SnoaL-like domain-containing protein n=1 Tax=Paracidovorax wautersii TaxID=1177982 RepID=A0A7V8JR48_9BURK|nr:MAG: hypothetical protein GAK30_01245 [Paracidovorax wautersii]